jgi:hypothetical protein
MLTICAIGCGDDDDGGSGTCKKAVDVLNQCDGVHAMLDPNAACSGQAQKFAQCIVDHPDAACGDQDATDSDEYNACAQAALQ